MVPVWLIDHQTTSSQIFFVTGIDSQVTNDSSIIVSQKIISPSTAILSQGRAITISHLTIS